MEQGMGEQESEVLAQQHNIIAMVIFVTSRFICTFLLKYIKPGKLLMYLAIGGAGLRYAGLDHLDYHHYRFVALPVYA